MVDSRRRGRTNLKVQPGQVGTSNATKPENMGMFDYAHLSVPLPADLKGSEIFQTRGTHKPERYFLMVRRSRFFKTRQSDNVIARQRRSADGYISATGMFKAAFPWAKKKEEEDEREFLKSLETTDQQEIAGNVWVTADYGTCTLPGAQYFTLVNPLQQPSN